MTKIELDSTSTLHLHRVLSFRIAIGINIVCGHSQVMQDIDKFYKFPRQSVCWLYLQV